jgi:hypothetical protein
MIGMKTLARPRAMPEKNGIRTLGPTAEEGLPPWMIPLLERNPKTQRDDRPQPEIQEGSVVIPVLPQEREDRPKRGVEIIPLL